MRERADSAIIAGWKRAHDLRGCQCGPEQNHVAHMPEYADVEPAQDGDVWRGRGWAGQPEPDEPGYWLTCPEPTCESGVHHWWHASDCPASSGPRAACKQGGGSCWTWTGSVEQGTLTASPSLFAYGSCGWHGFLRNGEMVHV